MSVFISHRHSDNNIAYKISFELKRYKVDSTIIDIDEEISDAEITKIILNMVNKCTHLIAIISDNTEGSWWVPFEIGVATQGEKRITSFDISSITLPGYLTNWPIITNYDELKHFANKCFQDNTFLRENIFDERIASARIQTAAEFHRSLKADLGQK